MNEDRTVIMTSRSINKHQIIPKDQSKMNNLGKLAIQGTQDRTAIMTSRTYLLSFVTQNFLYIVFRSINKHQRIPKEQSKMNNPEKLATQGTQDRENKDTPQYVLDITNQT